MVAKRITTTLLFKKLVKNSAASVEMIHKVMPLAAPSMGPSVMLSQVPMPVSAAGSMVPMVTPKAMIKKISQVKNLAMSDGGSKRLPSTCKKSIMPTMSAIQPIMVILVERYAYRGNQLGIKEIAMQPRQEAKTQINTPF